MAAHTYWRIINRANPSGQTGIGEVEMALFTGGADQCSGGTASASGTYGGSYSASSAFDDNTTSNWFQSGSGQGQWLAYQFSSAKEINEVRVAVAVEDTGGTPRIFDIESSDDGVTWTYEWTCYNTSWTNGVLVSFPRPVAGNENQWWGLHVIATQQGDGDFVASELQFRETVGGADATGSGTPSYYPADGGYPVARLFDDDTSTIIYSGTTGRTTMVRYDFGAPITIEQIALTSSDTSGANHTRCAASGYIMYSQDGKSWGRAGSFTGQTWGDRETKTFNVDAVPSDPVRVRAASSGNNAGRVFDINFPAAAVAGDTAYVFVVGNYGPGTTPGGWTQIVYADNYSGSGLGGAIWRKVLDSTDISTGHVSVNSGGGSMGWAIAVMIGEVQYRDPINVTVNGAGDSSTNSYSTNANIVEGDLILFYGNVRNWSDVYTDDGTQITSYGSSTRQTGSITTYTAPTDGPITTNFHVLWGGKFWRTGLGLYADSVVVPPAPTTRRRLIIVN